MPQLQGPVLKKERLASTTITKGRFHNSKLKDTFKSPEQQRERSQSTRVSNTNTPIENELEKEERQKRGSKFKGREFQLFGQYYGVQLPPQSELRQLSWLKGFNP